MSGDLRERIMEHVDVFEKCGKQQSAAFLREINERLAQLEQENANLRERVEELERDASRGRALRLAKEFLESAVSGEVGDDE